MRKTSFKESNNTFCCCPFCRSDSDDRVLSKAQNNRKLPQIRRFKSSETINDNQFRPATPKKKSQPVEIIFERKRRDSNSIIDALSDQSFVGSNRAKNFYGIWQKCHDSNIRMPWSMANGYTCSENILIESQEFGEGSKKPSFDSRVFPFQSTPSGNLKVVPQQVVFESKKVSVLVADPKKTKVNVKAELANQENLLSYSQPHLKKDSKIMDTDEKNGKKQLLANALSSMAGEGRVALNQILPGMSSNFSVSESLKQKTNSQINEILTTFALTESGEERVPEDLHSVESDDMPKAELNLFKLGFVASNPIDWNKIKLPQKTNLYKHMHYRITNYVNPDCLVQIEDVQFNCHLLVLQCYSAYFNEKTSRDVVKLPPESVSPRAFELIYEWMTYVHGDSYTILQRDNILEVFLAAQYLGIKELEEQCWAFIDCEELFCEATAFILYLEAKKFGISAIMEVMIPRIMRSFLSIVSSKDFLELQLDEVCVLLSSNYIAIHSEIEVFMSAVRWLWHDWKERKEYLEQIMACVRFGLIAPWQLVDVRRNPENPEFLEITSHPGVQQMIDNGLAFAIIKYWYGNQTGEYYHWIDLLGLTEPPCRNWTGEEKNYVTYREFLHDLERYRKELYIEKEKLRAKRENQPTKPKRVRDQSGLTTSPRDSLQQQIERSSKKNPSSVSSKSVRVENALGDSMKNEIILEYMEDSRKAQFSQQPPPTIWNANTLLKDSDTVLLKPLPSKLGGSSKNKSINSLHSRVPYASFPSNSQSGLFTSEPISQLIVPVIKQVHFLQSDTLRKLQKKNVYGLAEEKAAVLIQRAFKKYRLGKIRCGKADNRLSRRVSNDHEKPSKSREFLEDIRSWSEKFTPSISSTRNLGFKDYLREGSLYFPERESVIIFGGIDPHSKYGDGRNTGRNIFRYNSEINEWDLVGELPQPRHHHAVAFLKGKIYLAGGTDPRDDEKGKTVVVGTVWSFDPVSRSWYKESEMLTPRKNFGLTVMNGKLLAIGGQDKDGRILSSVERYDPLTRAWEYIASLNIERTGVAATKFKDTVWVAGGMTSSRKTPLTSAVESYDYKNKVWIEQANLRFPRCFGCLIAMSGVLYFIGGAGRASEKERTTSSCNAIDVWNPKEKEWKLHFAMAIPRHGHAIAYLGTQILIIGGVTTAYLRALTDVECFCCERKTWVRGLAGLPVPLSGHGAVTLPPASLM